MKKLIMFIVLGFVAQMTFTQVVVLNYMKVPAGGDADYREMENQWKQVHQNLVDEGRMLGWDLYYIHRTGTESEYNYVTVDSYETIQDALRGITGEDMEKVWGSKASGILQRTGASRDLVFSEMVGFVMGLPPDEGEKYLLVSFMETDDPDHYFRMEEVSYMPFHQVAIEQDEMEGWSIWQPFLYDKKRYDAIAVNGYKTMDQIATSDYLMNVEKSEEGKNEQEKKEMDELRNDVNKIRKVAVSQIWERINSTDEVFMGNLEE